VIEENTENSFKLNRIAGGLKECLNEIYRRNESSRKLNNLVSQVRNILSNDRELEIIKRQSFRLSYGDIIIPSLMPSLVDVEKESNIPSYTLNDFPIEFSTLEETKSLSDEFDIVLIGDPKEKIKQLERDNSILNDRMKILLQIVKDIEKEKKVIEISRGDVNLTSAYMQEKERRMELERQVNELNRLLSEKKWDKVTCI